MTRAAEKLCVTQQAMSGSLRRLRDHFADELLVMVGRRLKPTTLGQALWVWGYEDIDQFMAFVPQVSLVGHVQSITVPFLITHGANDRQIPIEYAHQCYAEAVNSPKRE